MDEYQVTAHFVEIIARWFTLMTARSPQVALGKTPGNAYTLTKFSEAVKFLESFLYMIRNMNIGAKESFKPVQRGVSITTTSVIELSTYLLEKKAIALCWLVD